MPTLSQNPTKSTRNHADALPLVDTTHSIHFTAAGLPPTCDYTLAADFVARYWPVLRVCHEIGGTDPWRHWDGNRWRVSRCREPQALVRDWLGARAKQTRDSLLQSGEETSIKAGKIAAAIASAKTRNAVLSLVADDPRLQTKASDWDSDPWLLGLPDGYIDLRTNETHDPDPSKLISLATSVRPDFNMNPVVWKRSLREWSGGDSDTIDYLQRLFGYALTGLASEHIWPVLYGPGGNGKGVLTSTVAGILGEYAGTLAASYLQEGHEQHSTGLAALRGKRLVVCSETSSNRALNVERVKGLTGGDVLNARGMHQNEQSIQPTWLLVQCTNHAPSFATVDDAIRRRFRCIGFNHRPPKPNPNLIEELRVEWPGILAWLCEGCRLWQRDGMNEPIEVLAASSSALDGQDPVVEWIAERCFVENDFIVECHRLNDDAKEGETSQRLAEDFNEWLQARGHSRSWTIERLGRRLSDLGHPSIQGQRGEPRRRKGILLRPKRG